MIELDLTSSYKSLKPFNITVPDFTILTGLNGSGKTQILTGIQQSIIQIKSSSGVPVSKAYASTNKLSPDQLVSVVSGHYNSLIENIWSAYQRNLSNIQASSQPRPQTYFAGNDLYIVTEVLEKSGKNFKLLSKDDIRDNFPVDAILEDDFFYLKFSHLFSLYEKKLQENKFRKFLQETEGVEDADYLTDEQFRERFGEMPWTFVNDLIEEANLDYKMSPRLGRATENNFTLKLIRKSTTEEIPFNEMSSGEKAIVSLALALYNSNHGKRFPNLLLLDEPDASLHPSMSKQLLNVLVNFFVRKKGIKVIMTSHSPSTISFAPEESIFVVNNQNPGNIVQKTNRDASLKALCAGVPSFSINYENRRQVFVESSNDVSYYEKIYSKVLTHLDPEVSLSFIASGDARSDKNGQKVSNCSQVIAISRILREAGNRFVWGLVDWDTTNSTNDYIKVLGDGKRYSIESYIFDPILVGALLLREKIVEPTFLGLKKEQNYTEFKNISQGDLQSVIDSVSLLLLNSIGQSATSTSKVKYMNGYEASIPVEYLHFQGHRLEAKIVQIFPALAGIKKNTEDLLKIELIEKVMDDLPGLIPYDILEAFQYIQS